MNDTVNNDIVKGGAEDAAKSASAKKKLKAKVRHVAFGTIHVYCTFNNTLVTITDSKGNVLAWSTAGERQFKGSRKSTPHAAQTATMEAARKVREKYGLESVEIRITGPGPGREACIRVARDFFMVSGIYDVTGIPFNGCRAPSERRV